MTYLKEFEENLKYSEKSYRNFLNFQEVAVIRLDMRSGGSFVKGLKKPWDNTYTEAMKFAAKALLEEVQGAMAVYTGSDEITIIMGDTGYEDRIYSPFFNGRFDKVLSLTSSIATNKFNEYIYNYISDLQSNRLVSSSDDTVWKSKLFKAQFDSRLFQLEGHPISMGLVAIHSRMLDVAKNSVQMLARHFFSHQKLQAKNVSIMKDMLEKEYGVIWENYVDSANKYGTLYYRTMKEKQGFNPITNESTIVYRSVVEELNEIEMKELFNCQTLKTIQDTKVYKEISKK